MIGKHLDFWPPPIYLPSLPFQQEQKNTIWVFQPCAPSISLAYLLKGNWSWSTCSCPPWWQSLGGELNRWVPSKWCRNWSLKNSLPNSVKVSTKSPLQAQVVRWRVRCKLNNGPLWGKTSWCTWRQLKVFPLQTDLDKASIYKFSNIQFKTYHQHTSLSLFLLSMEKLWCTYRAHPAPHLSSLLKSVPAVLLLGHSVSIGAQNNGRRATMSQFSYDQFLQHATWSDVEVCCAIVVWSPTTRWKDGNMSNPCESALTPPLEATRSWDQIDKHLTFNIRTEIEIKKLKGIATVPFSRLSLAREFI